MTFCFLFSGNPKSHLVVSHVLTFRQNFSNFFGHDPRRCHARLVDPFDEPNRLHVAVQRIENFDDDIGGDGGKRAADRDANDVIESTE